MTGANDAPELETIANYGCETTEGPLWHAAERTLYWLDIPPGRLYRYDPESGEHGLIYESGTPIGGFTMQADGGFLLFGDRGSIRLWRDGAVTTLRDEIPEERGTRFNDVIADPEGRVYCGTMPDGERQGRLWRLDPDGSLHLALADAGLSNGMGFTPDLRAFYHSDSGRGTITRYPYDRATGELGAGETIVRIPAAEGVPDGMAVDAAGDLWSARWDGSALFHYSPDGALLGAVTFPARKVSSITFGGPDYADAYVTCAGGNLGPEEGAAAGALMRTRLGVRGQPAFLSRIAI